VALSYKKIVKAVFLIQLSWRWNFPRKGTTKTSKIL